jgi:hypothetical protein
LTNQNEKKEESRPSLVEQFKKELDEARARFEPIMDFLMSEINRTASLMRDDEREGRDYTDLIAHREALAMGWLRCFDSIESKHRDYLLALRVEELSSGIKQTVDERLDKAVQELREKNAKVLASFYDEKGHEAMYGVGTKASRTD